MLVKKQSKSSLRAKRGNLSLPTLRCERWIAASQELLAMTNIVAYFRGIV